MKKNASLLSALGLSALVLSGMLLSACSKPEPAPEPVRAVRLQTVGESKFVSVSEFAGEVKARTETRMGFRVGGKIIKRQAELGQRVNAGAVLAQLDPQDYKLAADVARAQVAVAATNRDLAAADYKRYKELKDQNFISGAELERRDATLKAAQAQFDQAKSQLAVQGNQAGYAQLLAVSSGIVTGVEAEPGQVVTAGAPVVRIAVDGPRDAVFAVPEDRVKDIKPGMSVKLRDLVDGPQQTGKVREVSASADPATRTYQVKVAFNPGNEPPLGATVYATPQGMGGAQGAPVIKLPTTALWRDGQSSAVWVLDAASMTVKAQKVEVATADGNEAVIASGLQPGMRVVIAGVHVLAPGQKVSVYQEKVAAAQSTPAAAAINSVAASTASLSALAASAPK